MAPVTLELSGGSDLRTPRRNIYACASRVQSLIFSKVVRHCDVNHRMQRRTDLVRFAASKSELLAALIQEQDYESVMYA
jgi:hypothetical protein